jgi:HSP20 family molecular chaperone IbpA
MSEPAHGAHDRQPEETRNEEYIIPDVDIYETENGLTLLADMPGVPETEVGVSVDNDVLTVVGRMEPPDLGGAAEVYIEFRPTVYRRSFTVSRDINAAGIRGSISQGVLCLDLPKSDRARVLRISIQQA